MAADRARVVIFYGRGGGGHLTSARALAHLLRARHPRWAVSLHDASEVAGAAAGDALYNLLMSQNLFGLLPTLYALVRLFQPVVHPLLCARFRAFFRRLEQGPAAPVDLVVSCVPILNAVLCEVARSSSFRVVTVMTDFMDSPGHPWLQHRRQVVWCGTRGSWEQARKFGQGLVAKKMSGMVVHPRFYEDEELQVGEGKDIGQEGTEDKEVVRESILKVCVCFGGFPPGELVKNVVHSFARREDVQLLVICGGNSILKEGLERWVKKRRGRGELKMAEMEIMGRVEDMATYMRRCDVVVGKPGPGVVSEASVLGKPVVLLAKQVMEQEKPVVEWVKATGVGIVVQNGMQAAWVSRAQVELMQENLKRLAPNRAVFEVCDGLEEIMQQQSQRQAELRQVDVEDTLHNQEMVVQKLLETPPASEL